MVVASAGQGLPDLAPEVAVLRDAAVGQGPLEGLRVGLTALGDLADTVFVSGCDAPLLSEAFINFLFSSLGDADAAVPADEQRLHPLAAVYRPAVLSQIKRLSSGGNRSLHALLEACNTARIHTEQIRGVDPDLRCLVNINRPGDHERVLRLLEDDGR